MVYITRSAFRVRLIESAVQNNACLVLRAVHLEPRQCVGHEARNDQAGGGAEDCHNDYGREVEPTSDSVAEQERVEEVMMLVMTVDE